MDSLTASSLLEMAGRLREEFAREAAANPFLGANRLTMALELLERFGKYAGIQRDISGAVIYAELDGIPVRIAPYMPDNMIYLEYWGDNLALQACPQKSFLLSRARQNTYQPPRNARVIVVNVGSE